MIWPRCQGIAFRIHYVAVLTAILLACPPHAPADGVAVSVQVDATKAGPRKVEDGTRNRILADYRLAWSSAAQALQSNSSEPLQGPFTGEAKTWLTDTLGQQKRSGLSSRFSDQSHKVEVVFYAPEGDLMELHDTAGYRLQVLDRDKVIHDDNVTQRYVVLMTPAADRWVVRQLQAVSKF